MNEQATYPAIFADCNLDQINYLLREGRASKSDAAHLVEWWNTSGKRVTRAALGERLVSLGGCACMAPFISISNQ